MARCGDCQWKYPYSILNSMFVAGEGYTKPICGICALERVRAFHGVAIDSFTGVMAESARLSAIEWREKHPNDAPN